MSPTKVWSLVAGVVVAALLVGGWMFGISPQRARAADLASEAASQRQSDSALTTKIATLKAQQSDAPRQTARLAAIAQRVPDNPALPALVRSLTAAAKAAGVDLVSIAPAGPAPLALPVAAAPPAATDGTGDDAAAPAAPSAPVVTLQQIPLTLTVIGGYANIQQFLAQLEDLNRALVVDSLTIAPGAALQAASAVSLTSPTDEKWKTLSGTISARVFLSSSPIGSAATSGAASSGSPAPLPTTPSS